MEIITKNIEDVIPYKNNPRNNDTSVDYVAESIKEFGFKVPIIIDKNNIIVTGHTRLRAAKKLGLKTVPCILADDLTEKQIKAFRLADNKVSEYSTWNNELLNSEIKDLSVDDSDPFIFIADEYGFGKEDYDITKITEDTETLSKTKNDMKKAEFKETMNIQQGDIYKLDNHVLMCGDSTSEEDINKLIGTTNINMVLTDPPYGIGITGDEDGESSSLGAPTKAGIQPVYKSVKGDADNTVALASIKILQKRDYDMMIFGGNYFTDLCKGNNFVVWKKTIDNPKRGLSFADGEMLYCSFHTPCRIFTYSPVQVYDLLYSGFGKDIKVYETEDKYKRFHPTQKPVRLISDMLINFTSIQDNILDLFGGSGSTLIACEKTNRNCYTMEYDSYYVENIIKRWEYLTGKKAEKI